MKNPSIDNPLSLHYHHLIIITVIKIMTAVMTEYVSLSRNILVALSPPSSPPAMPSQSSSLSTFNITLSSYPSPTSPTYHHDNLFQEIFSRETSENDVDAP